jgi:hypothetical protein
MKPFSRSRSVRPGMIAPALTACPRAAWRKGLDAVFSVDHVFERDIFNSLTGPDDGPDRNRSAGGESRGPDHNGGAAVNPVSSRPGAPVIQSISAQIPSMGALVTSLISAQFHFVSPNGNAVVLHREAQTTGNNADRSPNQAINIPAEQQKQGATVTSLWTCNDSRYSVAVRAYIMDMDGNRSNEVRYTVHCNGG